MRINLNKQSTVDNLLTLCEQVGCSPTRLLIDILDNCTLEDLHMITNNSLAQRMQTNEESARTKHTNENL